MNNIQRYFSTTHYCSHNRQKDQKDHTIAETSSIRMICFIFKPCLWLPHTVEVIQSYPTQIGVISQLPRVHLPEAICIIFPKGFIYCPKLSVSFAWGMKECVVCPKGMCRLPKGIVTFARRDCIICPKGLYHLPLGVCITCQIDFNVSHGILSNRHL